MVVPLLSKLGGLDNKNGSQLVSKMDFGDIRY